MSKLIKKLKQEHFEISELFREIAHYGVFTSKGQKKLQDARHACIAHLEKEDNELYPVLWEVAKDSEEKQHKLELFITDMRCISREVSIFFDKYDGSNYGADFLPDFRELYLLITSRINAEESDLFMEYELAETLLSSINIEDKGDRLKIDGDCSDDG